MKFLKSTSYQDDSFEYSGFVNRTSSTLSFVDGTRTFTIAPNPNYNIYVAGNKTLSPISANFNIVISNTIGVHFIYFTIVAGVVTINETTTPWNLKSAIATIATVYWDGTKGAIGDERHGLRSLAWHEWAHKTVKTRYESGLDASGTITNTTTSISSGIIHDEDIAHTIATQTTVKVWYRNTGGATFKFDAATARMYKSSGGTEATPPMWDNAGTPTAAGSSNYVVYWMYASNDYNTPIYSFMGQQEYGTLTLARAATPVAPHISWPNLPNNELKLLYKVIFRNSGGATVFTEINADYRNDTSGIGSVGGTVTSLPASAITYDDSVSLFNGGISTNVQAILPLVAPRANPTFTTAINVPNNVALTTKTTGSVVDVSLIKMSATNQIEVGAWEGLVYSDILLKGGNGNVFTDVSSGNGRYFAVRGVSGTTPTEQFKVTYNGMTTIPTGSLGIGTTGTGTRKCIITTSDAGIDVALDVTIARTTGTNYAIYGAANGTGGTTNIGGFFTAGGAGANQGLRIYNVPVGANNYAIYSDAPAYSYIAGSVGIGVVPTTKFHIQSSGNVYQAIDTTSASSQAIINFNYNTNIKWQLGKHTDDSFLLWDNVGIRNTIRSLPNSHLLLMETSGSVVVGSTTLGTSAAKLDVVLADGATGFDVRGATGGLRILPYFNATYGAYFEAHNAAVDNVIPCTISSSKLLLNPSGGNVLIGLSAAVSGAKLEVGGSISSSGGIGVTGGTNLSTFGIGAFIGGDGTNGLVYARNYTGWANMYLDATNVFMNTQSLGSVGIGTNAPNKRLHVYNGGAAVSYTQLELEGRWAGYGAGITFSSRTSSGGALVEMARITADGEAPWDTTAANQSAGLRFFTTNAGVSSEKMRIYYNGNVGIGNQAPSNQLSIKDTAQITSGQIKVQDGSSVVSYGYLGNWANGCYLQAGGYYKSGIGWIYDSATSSVGAIAIAGSAGGSSIDFLTITTPNTTPVSRMVIDKWGNVGIGAAAPTTKLDLEETSNTEVALSLSPYTSTIGKDYNWKLIANNSASTYRFDIHNGNAASPYFSILNKAGSYAGFVGIGTVLPKSALQIGATKGIDADNIVYNAYYNSGWKFLTNNAANILGTSGGDFRFYTSVTGTADAACTMTEKFTILVNGNVGNGYATPSVESVVARGTAVPVRHHLQNSATGYAANNGLQLGIDATGIGYLWNYTSAAIKFGTANTERFTIESGGNLAIGAGTVAQCKLDFGISVANAKIVIGTWMSGNYWTGIGMDATTAGIRIAGDYAALLMDVGSYTYDAAHTWTSRMVVRGDTGNVGIGNTDPGSYKLKVTGDAYTSGIIDAGNYFRCIGTSGAYVINNGSLQYNALQTTSGATPALNIYDSKVTILNNGNVGVNQTNPAYKLEVVGSFAATTKSFVIPHPTKKGMKLRYGSLESPYHGIRLTGEAVIVNGKCKVELPNYIHALVKQEGSQVQITNIKHGKVIWVEDIDISDDSFTVMCDDKSAELRFYWSFTAIRKDVEDMVVEF